jgi:FtsZ-binding cell division protein ZapB
MTTPRHLELFIRDGRTAAQCRTETNGRLDDPVSIAVAGPEWGAFVADFGKLQAAEITDLTFERDLLQQHVTTLTAERDALQSQVDTIPGLQSQVAELTAEKATLECSVSALTSRVSELEAELSTGVDENGVPTAITPLQGRIVLKRAGLLATVEAAITHANGETQIWWEYATLWHRNHPVLIALGTSLGLSTEQVDEMFIQAASIA